MLSKLSLTICSFLCLILTLQAQVPGYQGKRFFAEIGISAFPNLAFPTAQNKGAQSFPFGYHTGHFTMKDRYDLSLYYVTGRRTAVKAAYNYQVSGLNTFATTPGLFTGLDYHHLFYQLHMHDVNLGLNLYRNRSKNLSPLGFFMDWGIRFVLVNGVLRDQRVEYSDNRPDHRPYADQLNPINQEGLLFMFGLTTKWGYRTVIANRLTLSFGVETTVFPQYMLLTGDIITGMSILGQLSNYQIQAIQNVQDRYLVSLHLGIGALIF